MSCINLFVTTATGMVAVSRGVSLFVAIEARRSQAPDFPDIGSLAPWVSLGNYIALLAA